jgi:serine/threonine protein kinase
MGLGEVLYRDDTVSMSGATSPELLWHIPPESFTISLRRGEPDENSALRLRTRNAGTLQGRTLEDDPRAEVYALGCLAYHALNGHHPFFSSPDDATEGIHATIRDTPLELKDHAAHSDLWRVVSQAIAREPAERYATPLEFAEAFADSVALVDPSSVEPVVSSAGQSRPTFFRDPAGDGELSSEWSVPVKASDGFQLWAWRFTSAVLFGIVLFYMLQPRLEPRTLVVTSDPPQLHFGEQVGHTRVDLGTTPIVLRERSVTAPLRLFVIGPDGYGATTEFDISQFTDLGHCSSVTVPLTFAGSGDLEDEQED